MKTKRLKKLTDGQLIVLLNQSKIDYEQLKNEFDWRTEHAPSNELTGYVLENYEWIIKHS